MSTTLAPKTFTVEEFLALPDDGVERWLIEGQLREKPPQFIGGKPVTVRNRFHTKTTSRVSTILNNWRDLQPEPRGDVHDGEVGVRLSPDAESVLGIDVVYISAEVAAAQPEDVRVIVGVPVLAVEVLSPSDTIELIHEKI